MKLHSQKIALTLGIFFGGVHLLWSALVLIGLGQPLLDFIFWAHMVQNPYFVTSFTPTQAVTLIIMTSGVGYLGGWIFAKVWNYLHRK